METVNSALGLPCMWGVHLSLPWTEWVGIHGVRKCPGGLQVPKPSTLKWGPVPSGTAQCASWINDGSTEEWQGCDT